MDAVSTKPTGLPLGSTEWSTAGNTWLNVVIRIKYYGDYLHIDIL